MKKILLAVTIMMTILGFSICSASAAESAVFDILEPAMTDKEFVKAFNSTIAGNGDKLRITSLKFAKSVGEANVYFCNFNYSTENKVGMMIFVRKNDSIVSSISVAMVRNDQEATTWGLALGGFALQTYTHLPVNQLGQILGRLLKQKVPYGLGGVEKMNGHYYDILYKNNPNASAFVISRGEIPNKQPTQQEREADVSDWLLGNE